MLDKTAGRWRACGSFRNSTPMLRVTNERCPLDELGSVRTFLEVLTARSRAGAKGLRNARQQYGRMLCRQRW